MFNLNYFSVHISLSALHLGYYSFHFQPQLELELDFWIRGKDTSQFKLNYWTVSVETIRQKHVVETRTDSAGIKMQGKEWLERTSENEQIIEAFKNIQKEFRIMLCIWYKNHQTEKIRVETAGSDTSHGECENPVLRYAG